AIETCGSGSLGNKEGCTRGSVDQDKFASLNDGNHPWHRCNGAQYGFYQAVLPEKASIDRVKRTQAAPTTRAIHGRVASGDIEGSTVPGGRRDAPSPTLRTITSYSYLCAPYWAIADIGTVECVKRPILVYSAH